MQQLPVGFLASILAIATQAEAPGASEPFVYAEYQPGATCDDCFGWRLTVFEDGTVTQEVKNTVGWEAPDEWGPQRTVRLSKRRLDRLRSVIQEVRFSTFRDEYSANLDLGGGAWRISTDQETDIVAIKLGGNIKRVSVYGPTVIAGIWHPEYAHPDREVGKRFMAVWAELLTLVRSPNSWQKARVYR